ncbi:MAG: penicillin-binding transpeptidase domain-containing protein, partial [Myxococcota bacterium]|nr:penicillin-binding transpeptidase domain-containing protein [Myxococcota bacterium]
KLTLQPALQEIATNELGRSHSAAAAFVAVDVKSGRLLSLAEHFNPTHIVSRILNLQDGVHMALRALAPGSVNARLVAAGALYEGGLSSSQRTCYQAFLRTPQAKHLASGGDECRTLSEAFVESSKGYFTRQSMLKLDGRSFGRALLQSGFNQPFLFFALPYEPSSARVPLSPLGRARAVSGTHGSRLSALHAALLATAIASNGELPQPRLVEELIHKDGRRVAAPGAGTWGRGFSPETSVKLRAMLRAATQEGVVKKLLRDSWPTRLRRHKVVGQIGIETHYSPFYRYSWFVGFYPAQRPRVAIASMVLNGERWDSRAIDVTSRIMKRYLTQLEGEGQPR